MTKYATKIVKVGQAPRVLLGGRELTGGEMSAPEIRGAVVKTSRTPR
ncbi:hypothetical protein AB0395_36465 [Streptosporangium sp. NPDC051023]